jgi:ribosome-associated heat shock protein Hsp15
MSVGAASIRLDKWLWQARFCKSRTLAAALVAEGRVRVNSERVTRPARAIGPGDVLTFPQGGAIRVVRVLAAGERRGPAAEAQGLYEDLSPSVVAPSPRGADAPSAVLE